MIRTYEPEELEELNVEDWQANALTMNPDYPWWGPHEDYMTGKDVGWRTPIFHDTWEDFGPWELDDYNECVNFYFFAHRENHECEACGGVGMNKETKCVYDHFYDFERTGHRWCDKITQDEVVALVEAGRLVDFVGHVKFDKDSQTWTRFENSEWVPSEAPEMPSYHEVNQWERHGIGHDAVNRWILIKTRAKRLGVYGQCPECGGDGYIYDEPHGKLGLVLWMLHPRKGASRGVEIKEITQEDLPKVVDFLYKAAERNDKRFGRLRKPTS